MMKIVNWKNIALFILLAIPLVFTLPLMAQVPVEIVEEEPEDLLEEKGLAAKFLDFEIQGQFFFNWHKNAYTGGDTSIIFEIERGFLAVNKKFDDTWSLYIRTDVENVSTDSTASDYNVKLNNLYIQRQKIFEPLLR